MVQINNFREFYNVHAKVFRCFGVIPIFKKFEAGTPPKLNVFMLAIIVTFLVVYWTGVVFAFLIERHMNDKISIISNWIQMLGNSVALTTTLGSTVLKYTEYENIIAQFHKIDDNLMAIGHKINYSKHLRRSKCIFFAYLGGLGGLMAYDFYITVDKYQMTSVWYWLISVTPLFIYSVGIYQAMFMIYWIKCRCSLMNKVLKEIRMNANGGRGGTPESKVKFLSGNVQCLIVQPREKTIPMTLEKDSHQGSAGELDMDILSQVFLIMNDLCKLARKIDEYYGLFLLTTIGALFAITSIQVYYCYVTAILFNGIKYSVWTLMVSINLVVINLSLVVGLCTMCENVSNEATKILQNFSALQIKKDMPVLSELSIWVHPMISYMKFSAYGFFTIDYNMLCGFMTALITYLVIFIQFYALNGNRRNDPSVRSAEGKMEPPSETVTDRLVPLLKPPEGYQGKTPSLG